MYTFWAIFEQITSPRLIKMPLNVPGNDDDSAADHSLTIVSCGIDIFNCFVLNAVDGITKNTLVSWKFYQLFLMKRLQLHRTYQIFTAPFVSQ